MTQENNAGKFPFLKGVYPNMYADRLWTMRQYSGFGGPEQTNQRFKQIIKDGGTGLSLAFDLPTQLGLDSDDVMSIGEVGRTGVSIDTLNDMKMVFKDINLGKVSTSMTINAPAAILLVFYLLVAEEQGVPWSEVRGTIQNDILKEYIARGTYIFPPEPSLRLISDLFEFCDQSVPKFNVISVSGYHIREAGASLEQELAYTLANGKTYVEELLKRGQNINRIGKQISFFFSVDNGFLEEIAKFRAARVIWAHIMKNEFNANDDACKLRFHCQTGGSTLTAQQPEVNSIRVTIQALSAILGGAQSLHTNSIDEAIGLPTENSARLALRTQQIIAHESNIPNYIDPLGGSEVIESLTKKYIQKSNDLIERIGREGGVLSSINKGVIQKEVKIHAYEIQKEIESENKKIIGVNHLNLEKEEPFDSLVLDDQQEQRCIHAIKSHRKARNLEQFKSSIDQLSQKANSNDNLIPYIVRAAKAGATLGEICSELKAVFGEYTSSVSIS